MSRNLIIIGAIIIILIGAVVLFVGGQSLSPSISPTPTEAVQEQPSSTDVMQKEEGAMGEGAMTEKLNVEIKNFAFSPKTLAVKKGTTIVWTNNDSVGHTATADDGSFDTGLLAKGESGSVTFDKVGTFSYHCTPHPYMKAEIVVE